MDIVSIYKGMLSTAAHLSLDISSECVPGGMDICSVAIACLYRALNVFYPRTMPEKRA